MAAHTTDRAALFDRLRDMPAEDTTVDAPTAPVAPPVTPAVVVYDDTPPIVTVPLAHPFTCDGVRIATIALRQPAFSDVEAVTAGDKSEMEMHANMAGISVAALRALRWSDAEMVTVAARHIAPDLAH